MFALGILMTPAAAQSPAEFYKGKTITIMLGHPPGSSYDLYARLAADHMKRFISGNPNIIVQHRPGGGGVAAVLTFYAQGARDGTMMGIADAAKRSADLEPPPLQRQVLQRQVLQRQLTRQVRHEDISDRRC